MAEGEMGLTQVILSGLTKLLLRSCPLIKSGFVRCLVRQGELLADLEIGFPDGLG